MHASNGLLYVTVPTMNVPGFVSVTSGYMKTTSCVFLAYNSKNIKSDDWKQLYQNRIQNTETLLEGLDILTRKMEIIMFQPLVCDFLLRCSGEKHVENRAKNGDYPTLFKVVFYTEVVFQKIQHVPLVMSITFLDKILRSLQEINA